MDNSMPIMLVPGLASSPRIFSAVMPDLWRFGPVTVANHSRDANMVLIARRILAEAPPRFALVGHSMGGAIAFELMRQAPERVAKLALINTYARPGTPEFSDFCSGWIAEVRRGGYHAVVERMFADAVHPSRVGDVGLKRAVIEMADHVGPDGFVRQLEAIMTRADSRATLAEIKCPTLVLTGDTDNSIPKLLSTEIAKGIPGARLVIVPNCGHLSPLEQPRAIADELVEWLRS